MGYFVEHTSLPWIHLAKSLKPCSTNLKIIMDKVPREGEKSNVQIFFGNSNIPINNVSSIINSNLELSVRQITCLEIFNKQNSLIKQKNIFLLTKKEFGKLLFFSDVIQIEIKNIGAIAQSGGPATFVAKIIKSINGQLLLKVFIQDFNGVILDSPTVFGNEEARLLDYQLRLYRVSTPLLPKEALSLILSPNLPVDALWDNDIRLTYDVLVFLGVDLTCLLKIARKSEPKERVILRVIMQIQADENIKLRLHLVTEFFNNYISDEVEIPAKGFLPPVFPSKDITDSNQQKISNMVYFFKRPLVKEEKARDFLFKIGVKASNFHRGFVAQGQTALFILSRLSNVSFIPQWLYVDKELLPKIIVMSSYPVLYLKQNNKLCLEASIGVFDFSYRYNLNFKKIIVAHYHNLYAILIDEDTIFSFDAKFASSLEMLCEVLNLKCTESKQILAMVEATLLVKALKGKIKINCSDKLKQELESFNPKKIYDDEILPEKLITELRPYQLDAFSWMLQLERAGLGRLLADDMGLGKTVMILSFLAKIREKKGQFPSLVVAPTSVIDVWINEVKKHVPYLKTLKWHGVLRNNKKNKIQEVDLVITSFALLRRDGPKLLHKIRFRHLIIDEAQHVKNFKTESWKAVKSVDAEQKIAISGTPIENTINDLWSILELLNPRVLGSEKFFCRHYSTPIQRGNLKRLQELKNRVSPIILRRKKEDVEKDLPSKIENILYCEMGQEQRIFYQELIDEAENDIKKTMKKDMSIDNRMSLLAILTKLRQNCCDPKILLKNDKNNRVVPSAKTELLIEILRNCISMNRKIIIYSQFIAMQKIIHEIIKNIGIYNALWLHGGTKNRSTIINKFQSNKGPRIIVVSLKAGGTGITLTAADTVIYYDPWWNPAVEDQAIDRAHRIGQTKTVHIIKLICKDTIEEQIVKLSAYKRKSANDVFSRDFIRKNSLTMVEIQKLLFVELQRKRV